MDPDLQRLVDRAAVVDLTIRYCTALDARDWPLLASCFADDAEATYGQPGGGTDGPYAGAETIVARLRRSMTALSATQHCVSNHVITVGAEAATSRCYLRAQHVRTGEDGPEQFMVGGMYDDRLIRDANGWRIASRSMTYTWCDQGWAPSGTVHPRS
jgi:3-phenylpropionate/cinnamic acid dioxygenase small subunit